MAGLFKRDRRSIFNGMHPADERSSSWGDVFAGYEDTPYLTGLVNVLTVLGTFVGIWTLIILLGDLHRGFGVYWSLILILVVDIAANAAARSVRAKRRRASGAMRERRGWSRKHGSS